MKETLNALWELCGALYACAVAYLFTFALAALILSPWVLLAWWLS